MPGIESMTLHRVLTPLREPYQLSYGPVTVLDSVFCRVQLSDGRIGWGESTPLPGYCPSDAGQVWEAMRSRSQAAIGSDPESIYSALPEADGFLDTALLTACEEACTGGCSVAGVVPLIGLLSGRDTDDHLRHLESARATGYGEFKMKIGLHPATVEAQLIREVQSALREGEWLRLDANQGLDLESAGTLAQNCDPARVRYLEQPLPEADWAGTARLAQISPVAIMLDESITDLDSIDKTASLSAASYIKLKWMKQGCATNLRRMVERATRHGLRIIFGNGVATGWNGRQETAFWLANLAQSGLPGEMNGFVKTMAADPGVTLKNGCAVIHEQAPQSPAFSSTSVVATETFGSPASVAVSATSLASPS